MSSPSTSTLPQSPADLVEPVGDFAWYTTRGPWSSGGRIRGIPTVGGCGGHAVSSLEDFFDLEMPNLMKFALLFAVTACNPSVFPEFSPTDACASLIDERGLEAVDVDGDGYLTRADVAPGEAVTVAEIHATNAAVTTLVSRDPAATYFEQPVPNQWTVWAIWDCEPFASLQITHAGFSDAATLGDLGSSLFFQDRKVFGTAGSQPDAVLALSRQGGTISGELVGTLRSGPLEDLLRPDEDDDLPQLVITHFAFNAIPTDF